MNKESHKHIQLEIDDHKIAIVIQINDIVVFSNRFHEIPSKSLPVNQYVKPGSNSLKVNVAINPRWFEELKEQSFDIVIHQYEGLPDNMIDTIIDELHWNYSDATQFPINFSRKFNLDIPYGNWTWLDADVLTDDTINTDSLSWFLRSIYNALETKNYESLEPFLKTKSSDLATAYGIPLQERLDDQKLFFTNELFGLPQWALEPLSLDNLLFQFHAQGRLVEVMDTKGKSPIQSVILDEGYNFSLPLFLCHKNNQWILCR